MTQIEAIRRAILADRATPRKLLGTAVVLAAATIARWLLGDSARPVPFVTYFPVVLLAALFYGWRWGALTTFIAAVIVNRVFTPAPLLPGVAWKTTILLVYFALSCAFLVMIGNALRRTVREMDAVSRQRDMLTRELKHRVKNTLSTVIALVSRGDTSGTAEDFQKDLQERLRALARATDLLAAGENKPTALRKVVSDALEPFGLSNAVTLDGPDCRIPGKTAYQLLLIVHELCTNALKHGALSSPDGRAAFTWTEQPTGLRMLWEERGGPAVAQPTRRGFGTILLKSQDAFKIDVDFAAHGLRCELTANS